MTRTTTSPLRTAAQRGRVALTHEDRTMTVREDRAIARAQREAAARKTTQTSAAKPPKFVDQFSVRAQSRTPKTSTSSTKTSTTVTRIDRETHRTILAAMDAAVRSALAPFGVTITVNRNAVDGATGMYSEIGFRITVASPDGAPVGREASAFTQLAAHEGMDPAWLGKSLRMGANGMMTIVGYKTRSPKRPIIVRNVAIGKSYVVPVDDLKVFARAAGWTMPKHWTNDNAVGAALNRALGR